MDLCDSSLHPAYRYPGECLPSLADEVELPTQEPGFICRMPMVLPCYLADNSIYCWSLGDCGNQIGYLLCVFKVQGTPPKPTEAGNWTHPF